jgi:N-acetylneuraminic acid mutarotase
MKFSSARFSIIFAVFVLVLMTGPVATGYAQSNTWSSGAPMPTPTFGAAIGVIKGNVYVVSGATSSAIVNNNEIYNPKTNQWTTGAPIPTARFVPASAVVNNILYVIGGSSNGSDALTVVEAYNPATNTWSTKAPMPQGTNSMYAVAGKNIIYVVGGYVPGQYRVATVYSYNPATDSWKQEASMKVGKSNPATGYLGGVIAAGGYGNNGDVTDTESYSTASNKWKTLTAIPTARAGSCFGTIKGAFYVASGAGGGDNNTPVAVQEAYHAATKSWTTLASIPQAVIAPASAVVSNKLYCFGGSNSGVLFQGVPVANLQIYRP